MGYACKLIHTKCWGILVAPSGHQDDLYSISPQRRGQLKPCGDPGHIIHVMDKQGKDKTLNHSNIYVSGLA